MMRHRSFFLPVASLVLLLATTASADYLEVRRFSTLKAAPNRDAVIRARPQPGDFLALLNNGHQTDGYYRARVSGTQTTGWIYRTLVRRYEGSIPSEQAESGFTEINAATSWSSAKNRTSDNVYDDNPNTLYCGCLYTSHNDSDGSGDVDLDDCDMEALSRQANTAGRIEWEHIVPASLMPARQFACWENPGQFADCVSASGNVKRGRACCEDVSAPAQRMIFDLHNLAPSVGQVNQYRKNGRYGEVTDDFEEWPGCDVRDTGGTSAGAEHLFEPADCTKGDVARVWFYMHDTHGVVIPDDEWNVFVGWSEADPVSPWEVERDARIAGVQGNHNPYVHGFDGDPAGACEWEPPL